jgi:hypothetical protein
MEPAVAVRLATFSIVARCPRTGMPKGGAPAGGLPEPVAQRLLTPPPFRPGGGAP